VDSVLTAVQGVDWRTLGEVLLTYRFRDDDTELPIFDDAGELVKSYPELDRIGRQYESNDDRRHAVVETWVQGSWMDEEPSWRCLIWSLDGGNIARVADNIRHFAEPVLGKP